MKRILATLALGIATSFALARTLSAQILTVNPGFTATPLFTDTPGTDIQAIGSDSAGNLYYLDSGTVSTGFATELIKRTAASNYQSSSILYTYSGSVFGDFVKVNGSTVYFGESTNGTIQSIGVNGGLASLIATVPFNYDMAFSGSTAFIDASDSNFVNNTVSRLNLSTGALTTVLKTNGASGPIAFNSSGSLLYGASTFVDSGGIYSFSSSQVTTALTGTPLVLANATPVFNNGANQYLASVSPSTLYQANSSFDGTTSFLQLYNPTNLTFQTAGQIDTPNEGDLFGGLAVVGNGVAVSVASQFGSVGETTSEVFLVTPEPGSAMLLAIGGAWMIGRRRFRMKRHA